MNSIIRTQIQSYLIEYLQKKMPNFEVKGKMMRCPFEDRHMEKKDSLTMNEYPVNSGKLFCFDPACGKLGDIFKMCRYFDFCDNEDVEDEDIAEFLIKEFNIQTQNEIEGLLAKYSNWGWDLVPVSRNDKASNIELSWQNKSHKSLSEWRQWLQSNLNFGMKTGKMSNTICVDFDLVESKLKKRIYEGNPTENQVKEAKEQHETKLKLLKEKLAFIDWSTVNQTSFGGVHLFYVDDKEIPSTSFDWEGIHIDILADGKQVVIEPSVVGNYQRKIVGEEIKLIPKELKEFILSNCKKESKEEQVKVESTEPDSNSVDLTFENLNNNRNNTFIKLAGELRRKMTIDQTGYAVYLFNQLLDRKLPQKELNAMLRQAEKYHEADLSLIESKIIEHLKIVETAHIRDLKECLGFERKDLEQALKCLCDHKKLYKVKKDLYKLIQATEWQTDFMSIGKPIDFKIPFFNDYAHFDDGAMIVIGGSSGTGKTVLTMNFIKQFVEQGLRPNLITTEAGSKFGKIAQCLGLKEGDFVYKITNDPTLVPLESNAITIVDWLKPIDGDYAKTDVLYEHFNNQLVEKGGLLIIFAQLKKENHKFYAEDMVNFYASLVAKIIYPSLNGVLDNLNPYFKTEKIRDSKVGKQYLDILLTYNPEDKRVRLK